jgi:lipopolysaccharide transport system permease protein
MKTDSYNLSAHLLHNTRSLFTSPLFIARDFFFFLRSIYQNNYMIRSMVVRDIKARYIGSFLGFFWTIIHPLTQIFIYYFIFSVLLRIRLGPEYGGTNFAIWLISGLLPWFFFAEVVNRSPMAILEQSHIITKTVFPSEVLAFTHLISAFINHLIGMVILASFLLIFAYGISLKILLVFPIMLIIGVFAIGISWALSALNVFLRDIGQIIGVILHIWFFMTPIIYPPHTIPHNLQRLYRLNPMLHIIEAYRFALLGKTNLTIESLPYILTLVFVTFIIGGLIFKKLKPGFADAL